MLHFKFRADKKTIIICAAAFLILLLVIQAAITLSSDKIYKGVSVDGINLSGMTASEAKASIDNIFKEKYLSKTFSVSYGNEVKTLRVGDISVVLLTDDAINRAYQVGRTGDIIKRFYDIISVRRYPVNITADINCDRNALIQFFSEFKPKIDREEQNATVIDKNGAISINKEIIGRHVAVDKNVQLIENNIKKRVFGQINLVVEENIPEVNYNNINTINSVLSSFSTVFSLDDTNRCHNIKLGCERINNTILFPNDIFSMNKALGPRTTENGYREAPVIFKNELVPGTGGGVCQITSTLYNAVLLSRLAVIERTHHSWPLGYIDAGRDATIAEDYIDFKFQNSTAYPICVKAQVEGNKLLIKLLGKEPEKKQTVKIKSSITEEIEPQGEELAVDNSLSDDQRIVSREARKGLKAVVIREIYNTNGELLDTEKISEDIYNPLKVQIKVNQKIYNQLKGEN